MKQTIEKQTDLHRIVSSTYLVLLGILLPLAVHHAYYDITLTKAYVFWILSGGLLFASVFCLLLAEKESLFRTPPAAADILFSVFALCHIISTLIFRTIPGGFLASDNRYQGVLSFLLYLCCFFYLRRNGRFSPLVRFSWMLGMGLMSLSAIAEVFGADPIGLRAVSPERQLMRFLSLVGNISFVSAMCVLFLPLAGWYALSAEKWQKSWPYILCALLALCAGLASRAESFVLGTLFFLAVLPVMTRDPQVLGRIPLMWASTAAVSGLFAALMRAEALYPPSDLAVVLCAPAPALFFVVISAALFLFMRKKSESQIMQLRRVYLLLLSIFFVSGLVFLFLANTVWRDSLPASIASVAVFSPSWGTDRGAEWQSFWQMFLASPLPQKLIGSGAGSLAAWDRTHRLFSDAVTDSAHNEYLHYLLTGGIIGLGAYLTLLGLSLREALCCLSREKTALALACAAYAVQAVVNIAQPFTTPLFFALLALLTGSGEAEEAESEIFPFLCILLIALAVLVLLAGMLMSRAGAA